MKSVLILPVLIAALTATSPCLAAQAPPEGLSVNQFRLVYPGAENKGITWSLTNNTPRAYLMQSWIRAVDVNTGLPAAGDISAPAKAIPMLVTPPLKRVDPGEQLTLRIRLTDSSLPQDRESVFYLSVKGIPSVPDKTRQAGGQLVVALVNNMKLFYRPQGLPAGGVTRASEQLVFSLQGDALVVDNPTPFFINFSQLKVGGKPLPAAELRKLVPPKGQQRYPVARGSRSAVEWQAIGEDSRATPVQRQTF